MQTGQGAPAPRSRGSIAKEWPIRVVLANPTPIVAPCAELHDAVGECCGILT